MAHLPPAYSGYTHHYDDHADFTIGTPAHAGPAQTTFSGSMEMDHRDNIRRYQILMEDIDHWQYGSIDDTVVAQPAIPQTNPGEPAFHAHPITNADSPAAEESTPEANSMESGGNSFIANEGRQHEDDHEVDDTYTTLTGVTFHGNLDNALLQLTNSVEDHVELDIADDDPDLFTPSFVLRKAQKLYKALLYRPVARPGADADEKAQIDTLCRRYPVVRRLLASDWQRQAAAARCTIFTHSILSMYTDGVPRSCIEAGIKAKWFDDTLTASERLEASIEAIKHDKRVTLDFLKNHGLERLAWSPSACLKQKGANAGANDEKKRLREIAREAIDLAEQQQADAGAGAAAVAPASAGASFDDTIDVEAIVDNNIGAFNGAATEGVAGDDEAAATDGMDSPSAMPLDHDPLQSVLDLTPSKHKEKRTHTDMAFDTEDCMEGDVEYSGLQVRGLQRSAKRQRSSEHALHEQ